jgi:hypothetical protein
MYTLDMLRELFIAEEIRSTGKSPPTLSSIASTEDDDGLGVIIVTFGGDTDG